MVRTVIPIAKSNDDIEFHKGRISAKLTPHSSLMKTSCSEVNVNTVSVIIRENWHVSLQNLALQVNMPKTYPERSLAYAPSLVHVHSTLLDKGTNEGSYISLRRVVEENRRGPVHPI